MKQRSKKKKRPMRQRYDLGTDEKKRHSVYIVVGTAEGLKQSRNVTQTVLDYYLHRRLIREYQHEAGSILFKDAKIAMIVPGVASTLGVLQNCGGGNYDPWRLTAQQEFSRNRMRAALMSIRDTTQRSIVANVVIMDWLLKDLMPPFRKPSASLVTLRKGLNRLAKFYKII